MTEHGSVSIFCFRSCMKNGLIDNKEYYEALEINASARNSSYYYLSRADIQRAFDNVILKTHPVVLAKRGKKVL